LQSFFLCAFGSKEKSVKQQEKRRDCKKVFDRKYPKNRKTKRKSSQSRNSACDDFFAFL